MYAPVDYGIRLEGVTLKGLAEHGQSQSVASARHTLWLMTSDETSQLLLELGLKTAQLAVDSEMLAGRTPDASTGTGQR